LHIRGKYHFEEDQKTGRTTIVFTEIPYQVNKAKTIERIAELVKEKKLEGISELRDESDKDGMRIAIDLKRGENAEVVVNNLFQNTQLENSFSINMVCLDNGQPKLMNLKDIVAAFIRHRQEVVTRRTMFELRKARERGHILEGLTVALANIDAIIETIKTSANPAEARERLQAGEWAAGNVIALLEKAGSVSVRPDEIEGEDPSRPFGLDGQIYRLSPAQVGAILELRLHRLTGLEQDKLQAEYTEILGQIAELTAILNDFNLLMAVIKEELALILQQYGDARRTAIVESRIDFSREDLIPEEQVVLTVSKTGYAKTQPLSDYAAQRRGGRGKSATSMKEDDYIQHLIVTSNHATVLCFTNVGKVYRLRVFEVPQASRGSKGRPMVNLLPLDADETITAILPVIDAPKKFKERLAEFKNFVRSNVATLRENSMIDAHYEALKASFDELAEDADELSDALRKQLKELGVELSTTDLDNETVVEFADLAEKMRKNFFVFMATASGTVKRVELEQFSNVRSNGLRAIELKEEDTLIGVAITDGEQQIMLFSNEGKAIRFSETDARVMGRTAKGVRGMRVTLAAAQAEDDVETDTDSDDEESSDLNVASRIVSLVVVPETGEVLCASANGYGKRTPVDDFPTKKRGGKGVIAIKTSERNGELVGAVAIDESKELMLISDGGTLVRTRASEVARTGRNAQGVRLIRLGNEEILVGVVAVEAVEVEDDILDASIETTEETVVDEVNVDASENTTDTNTSNED
jgi:DNA gyrase subunit A